MSFQATPPISYRDALVGYNSAVTPSGTSSLSRKTGDIFDGTKWLTQQQQEQRKQDVLLGRAVSLQAPDHLFARQKQHSHGYSRVPNNSPLGFKREENPFSGNTVRQSSSMRTFPKTGETGKIPTRLPGESLENYLNRAGGISRKDASDLSRTIRSSSSISSGRYQMPQGRLADDVNAIYQPNGRWIFSNGKQEFQRGKIIDGNFVKESPVTSHTGPSALSSRFAQKYPDVYKPAARYNPSWPSANQGNAPISNSPLLLKNSSERVQDDVKQTLEKEETEQCWTCTGIAIATVGAVAALVLATLMSIYQPPLSSNSG